ncbi:N-acetylglucosamine-6-phosphate deacetylase [Bowmanella denitrificans]|uniref:N-acetylgalactosamine-6-phosphate deacetylase n=1 Tax=Bowmanella denitrificans TaxID=366582 RepID=A0ABN0WT24_9ALTE|nr:N-acetylglucosamine-6-phosphate deacetylase [Bowmanella denitrificans]
MAVTYLSKAFFDGEQLHQNASVTVENGKVLSLEAQTGAQVIELDGLLVPGFVDVQVNGGGGVLFNTDQSVQGIAEILKAHARFGTTAMLPTLITDDLDVIQKAANGMAEAIAAKTPGIHGIHFEGPHLSKPKKGIHREQFIRPISDAELAQFCRQDLGKVLVTLAPENVPADVIRDLVKQGVKVCLGHSNADVDTTLAAIEAGADGFTHLFNAMSAMTSREPGMVGAALASDSYCGLILDHYHVHAISAKAAIKAKGIERIMLVTDAMAHVGADMDELPFFDTQIRRNGDMLTIPGGTLAGSALDMASAVRNCHRDLGFTLAQSLQMASLTPACYLGLDNKLGKLQPGFNADMVLLDDNQQVKQNWIGGQAQL